MVTDETPSFGTLLSRYRAALAVTQEDLAERAGLSTRAIGDLERGIKTRPRAYTVGRLAEALHLSPADRSAFERSARTVHTASGDEDLLPRGNFLGAVPAAGLVARDEERERIRSILISVADGTGHTLVLCGEAGAGKTRLLQEVMLEARDRGYLTLTGRCSSAEQQTPYHPFVEVLGELAMHVPGRARADAQRAWKRIQHLMDRPVARDSAIATGAIRQQLFGAISDLLLLASRSSPLALLIDDLQWADPGSLKLLHSVSRSTSSARILLAATLCDVDLTEQHPELAWTLQDLGRERLAERVTVRRLSLDETTELAATIMGQRAISEEFASFVYRRTKGNPRLIDQLVRSLGGRLELQGEIGAGSMGRVFRAFDRATRKSVAAKLVLARSEIDLDTLLRFQQEGAVLAKLEHRRIVDIYDAFVEEHAACIIMELVEGRSLGQLLQDGPLPLARAKTIGLQVAEALAYAHSQSIVHRDIKPDNVMVLENDQVKVTDFGIARILQPDTSLQAIATTGMRMGTPLYMAPEQIEGKQIDARTDIYALGATLYHMVTGRPPFGGGDALAVAVKHLQQEPVPPSSVDSGIPAEWDALILKAMARDPARRFQRAQDMQEAIASLGEKTRLPAHTTRRAPWLAAAIGLVLAVVAAAAGLWAHAAASHPSALSARLDNYFGALAAREQLSGTVLVADRHGPVFDRGYGYADRAARIPNRPSTKYADVAVTTSVSIADIEHLIQLGHARWGDKICTYLSGCPLTWKRITLRALLDGTSHLPDYAWGNPGNTTQQTLGSCQARPLDPPSLVGKIEYQVCTNLVLGLITEKLEALPWSSNQTLQLAGMQNTAQLTDATRSPERALDYMGRRLDPNTTYNDFFVSGSTVADEYAFDNALFGGRLVSGPNLSALLAPRAAVELTSPGIDNTRWGYYWETGSLFHRRVTFTYAQINHFLSVNMRFPATGLTVIVLSNDSGSDVLSVAIHAAALASGIQMPAIPTTHYVPRSLLGTYRRTFTSADQRSIGDPGLLPMVGLGMTLTIRPGYVHLDAAGSQSDEYYRAERNGRVELLRYLPANYNNICQVQPNITPPTGYFRWSLKGKILNVSAQRGNHCNGQAAFFGGRWTRTG